MEDLSTRFMGTSTARLAHTLEVPLGLKLDTGPGGGGKVRANRFPQGTLQRGKVPVVSKNLVHNLQEAAIAECVYTDDTFETDDEAYRSLWAGVCGLQVTIWGSISFSITDGGCGIFPAILY